ncbi:hypothetical protein AZE42_11933 [Rhizopogon vesiculosus]|uniref:Uncharacterized protein n=1 Tax=Rhizopogon vesiculosus TaxID=180088 RepID=A0A1J8QRE2_9AGAM|nr:hypothetical protein AZE42_11933 [Rhizopogon vesiculosus]
MPKRSLRTRVAIENFQGWAKKRKVSEDANKENKCPALVEIVHEHRSDIELSVATYSEELLSDLGSDSDSDSDSDLDRRFAIRSSRFMDAYHKSLNGSQPAWAAKYRGHRVLPSSIRAELDAAKII